MLYRIKIIDENTGAILVMSSASKQKWAVDNGFSENLYEVEKSDIDGTFWMKADTSKGWTGAPMKSDVEKLEEAKKAKVQEINRCYASRVSAVKADTVQEEVDTWDIQRLESKAWELDSTVATPQLDIIALNRGIPREEMIQRTLAKTKAFEQYVFTLLGTKQKYEDMVEAATTIEEIQAIIWE